MSRSKDPHAAEHALHLRRAMAMAGLTNGDLSMALGVSSRTIVNWISRKDPTMPSDKLQEQLRRLLPGYADRGDPVELAVTQTDLAPFRQAELVAVYKRLLHEQSREDAQAL